MMLKFLAFLCFLFVTFAVTSQDRVGLLTEELPNDTLNYWTIKDHSTVLPLIRTKSLSKLPMDSSKKMEIIPLLDLNYRYSSTNEFRTGAGFSIDGTPKEKFYVRLSAIGGVGSSDSTIRSKGYFLASDSLKNQYFDVRCRGSYTPNSVFNFQLGLDNNFIGEGSRSLFLGDYGHPYPFGMIRTQFWRVEYTMIYQFFREVRNNSWWRKNGVTHYISFNPAKWLNLGVFETVGFQPKDTLLVRGFDVEYLNPAIFYRPQEYALGSSDNVLLGFSMNLRYKQHVLYSQLILDEFSLNEIKAKTGWWANKYGGQIGVKGKFLSNGINYFYRVEMNAVRPYTYSHLNSGQNYGNQGMVLAHPLGGNFYELLVEMKAQKKKLLLKGSICYFLKGLDKDGFSYGGDIYQPYNNRPYEYGHYTSQGNGNNGFRLTLFGSYTLHAKSLTNLFAELQLRYDSHFDRFSANPMIGIRSVLWNDYRNY